MKQHEKIVLDLTGCRYLGEIHQRIKKTFSFPDYYGENWDAFLDAFRTVGVPDEIVVKGTGRLPEALKPHIKRMQETLEYMHVELLGMGQMFSYEIMD